MTAVLLSLAAATSFALGLVLTQFGLRHVHPLSGAAISIPTFTLAFICVSPILLRGETVVWSAIPIFAAVGLVYPAVITLLTFAGNRVLGPIVTGSLGNLAPLFSVPLAVVMLHEPLRFLQWVGLVIVVLGILLVTVTRTQDLRGWRSWALLLPLGAAALRGLIPPVIKLGLESWPSPLAAGLTGYIFSTVTVLTVERWRNGRFIVAAPWRGRVWFGVVGLFNGVATLLLYAALHHGPVTVVAPLASTYPLLMVPLSMLLLGRGEVTLRLAAGTAVTVVGVVLLLVG